MLSMKTRVTTSEGVPPQDKHQQLLSRAEAEAPLLLPRLQSLRKLHAEGVLSPPDTCVAYIIAYLQIRHGSKRWTCGRRTGPPAGTPQEHVYAEQDYQSISLADERLRSVFDEITLQDLSKLKLEPSSTLRDLIRVARFTRVPEHVPVCLWNYYAGLRPLVLMWRVPTPDELLAMQADGRRCVSALVSEKALHTVFGHRDCLDMLMHDLSHMEKFIEVGRYWQQVGFFEFLKSTCLVRHKEHWGEAYGHRWRLSWQYVSSDMNAVANHMLQTFKVQLMVAIARATLVNSGHPIPENLEDDTSLAHQHSDVYPRAQLSDWEPLLKESCLLNSFEEAFQVEWDALLHTHVRHMKQLFSGIFPNEDTDVERTDGTAYKAKDFLEWARPSEAGFICAAKDPCVAPARADNAGAIIAHFDELGRKHIMNCRAAQMAHEKSCEP